MRHVSQSHAGAGTAQEIAAMISLSEKPLDIRSGISCPICGVNLNSARQYQSHVGRHQEQLALFALPELETNGDSDPEDEGNSDSDSINVESDHSDTNEIQEEPREDQTWSSSLRDFLVDSRDPSIHIQKGILSGYDKQNKYFVPRDGIDREVITADICRYLGNDALMRPDLHKVSLNGGDQIRAMDGGIPSSPMILLG